MPWDVVFFAVLAVGALFGAILTILSENPVHSAVGLVITFINVAGLFVMLGADFLAVLQIVAYAGAIMVLVLFVVMLVDPSRLPSFYVGKPVQRYVSGLIGLILLLEVGSVIITRTALEAIGPHTPAWITQQGGNVEAVGTVLFSDYGLAFEVASVVLTVGVVGAVVIGLPERLGETRSLQRSTISLGHARGRGGNLPALPKFETPIDIPDERYAAPEGPRRVVMAKSADEFTNPGEAQR